MGRGCCCDLWAAAVGQAWSQRRAQLKEKPRFPMMLLMPTLPPGLLGSEILTCSPVWCLGCCCSVAQLCLTLFDPMDCSMPGFPVLHHLPEFAQTHVYWVDVAIQPSNPLSSPSPPALNLSQHQGLFQWLGSSHQVAKVLELHLQHQSFQWIFQGWFPLRLTGLIFLSKGFSRVFSSTTVWKKVMVWI